MTTLAYCPTMEPFAQKIAAAVPNIQLMPMGGAAQVLSTLRGNRVDIALIGRVGYTRELDDGTNFLRLQEGLTLAYRQKAFLPEEKLKGIEVVTYLPPEKTAAVAHYFGHLTRLDSLEACLAYNLEVPVLVDWQDFRDDFGLLIPSTPFGKTPAFRAPVIYYKKLDDDTLAQIQQAVIGDHR